MRFKFKKCWFIFEVFLEKDLFVVGFEEGVECVWVGRVVVISLRDNDTVSIRVEGLWRMVGGVKIS